MAYLHETSFDPNVEGGWPSEFEPNRRLHTHVHIESYWRKRIALTRILESERGVHSRSSTAASTLTT
jgi:hypothetical protein